MNWADWAIIAILSMSMLISIVRGFVKEAMSLAVWIASVTVATLFYQQIAVYLDTLVDTASLRFLIAWLGLFFAVLIVGGLLNFLLAKLVNATGLSGTDRLLGMLFGAARGAIIVMTLLIILPSVLPVDKDLWWHDSLLIPEFLRFEGWAREAAAAVSTWVQQIF